MSEIEDAVIKLYKAGTGQREIARELELSRGRVQRILIRLGYISYKKKSQSPEDRIIQEVLDKRDDLNAKKKLTESVKEVTFRTKLSQELEKHAKVLPPATPYKSPPETRSTVTETLLLHLSDWHADEVVKQDSVMGLNNFNGKVVTKRVRRVIDNAIEIKNRLQKGGYRFPNLVVAVNGDMVSGTIHEIEKHSSSANVIQSVLKCAALLAESIRDLSGQFENVYCFCTSSNHGRLPDARKIQLKEPTRSWDYLIYKYAELALQDCHNVRMEIPDSWAAIYEVEGKVFYQGHGHFIKSWNSIPFYGISRMTSKLGSIINKHFRPIDYWLFGHFHVHGSIENAGGEYLINPSLIGPQEFGIHCLGDATPPGQSLFGIHKKYGITHRWKLNAEENWEVKNHELTLKKISS